MATVDDYPVTSAVKRVTIFSGGTAFLDGFNMIIASVALALSGSMFSPGEMGLYASMYLVGVFLAAFVGGRIGDKLGRTVIFRIAPIAIAVISIILVFVASPWVLIIGRFLTGVCIGADYPMASMVVSECNPNAYRNRSLVILMMAWYVGALAGSLVGFGLYGLGDNWPWLYATISVFAVIVAVGRMSIPETPRWLLSQGRRDDADAALKKIYGPEADVADLEAASAAAAGDDAQPEAVTLGEAFRRGYLKRFIFVCGFWVCQCIPVTAIFMFGPTIMQMFGLGEGSLSVLGTAVIYIFFMLGVAPAISRIETMSRRKTVIWTYVIMSIGLTLLGIFSDADPIFILVCFVIYSLAYGLQSVLDNTYPPELFPTEVRGAAIGTVTSISKLGGAVAAQLFPMGLAAWGLGPVVLVGAGISVIGLVISILLAPETQGKTLEEASRLD